MAVRANINQPAKVTDIDPRSGPGKTDTVKAMEAEVAVAKARRELVQEQQLTKQIMQPEPAPEPPIKITGGINLGTIDLQEQQRTAREEAIQARKDVQARLDQLTQERDSAKEALSNASMAHLKDSLLREIETLKSAIVEGGQKGNGDLASQLASIEATATKLGYVRGSSDQGSWDAQLSLKKLEADMARDNRRFAQEMKRDERLWQIELKKLDMAEKEANAKIQAELHKWDMLGKMKEDIGGIIAKGLIDRGESNAMLGSGSDVGREVQSNRTEHQIVSLEAEEGETGEIPCPRCKTPVGIAPTTTRTACARCNQMFAINRIPVKGIGIDGL